MPRWGSHRLAARACCCAAWLISSPLHAYGLELGLAAVDESDDRASPAAVVRGDLAASYFLQGVVWGKTFGPVTQRTVLVTFGAEPQVKGLEHLHAVWGVSAMDEYVGVYEKARTLADGTTQKPIAKHNYNLGAELGARYELFAKSPVKLNFGWESHLFLAGSSGIFLVFGIKQVWSIAGGMDL